MSDYLRKSIQDLDLGIDETPVSLPPEFCARAAIANRFSLVVTTVNPRKQNLRALIGQMPRVWGFADSCVGRILGQGRVQFVFQSEEALNLGIPLLYLSNDMAEYVGNQIGLVKHVDFDENATMVEFVRVQMAWNFDNPLRFQRMFHFNNAEGTIVKFKFERLRSFCTKCGSLKHDIKDCTLGFDDPQSPPAPGDDDNDDSGPRDPTNNQQQTISEASSLKTIDPFQDIPGLTKFNGKSVEFADQNESMSTLPRN
ncbi:unnamed protein product [Arabidopsis arenosa]|uniref:Zinc knuckle CX2CX4HX4C domain-containing protein n=1 Tax=Arabidopsis arenosa TaxID=38785 RepID=A0A8S2A159_ARAAE|nr:unnamed protein product [Arabidopsis arenosa]